MDCDCAETGGENPIVFLQGDCRKVMSKLKENSIDSVVTDPPYNLKFMGKAWDATGIAFQPEMWKEVLRVLKPGGHLLAMGGTRTHHRLWCAVEDAGFEIRDTLMWLYGTGFPKSLDVSKAIDKAAGAEREVVGEDAARYARLKNQLEGSVSTGGQWKHGPRTVNTTASATDAAKQWEGWGTALKPAWEPILLARKPLIGTVAVNVQAHGTGALNVGRCRIPNRDDNEDKTQLQINAGKGRWPANVLLDEEAGALLDAQSGECGNRWKKNYGEEYAKEERQYGGGSFGGGGYKGNSTFADSGGASRFFYCAKASRKERGEGNTHPTVKPLALMRWLVRLITPPGGKVLDPFIGSGTTALAAKEEAFRCIGIDTSDEYLEIARRRCGLEEATK